MNAEIIAEVAHGIQFGARSFAEHPDYEPDMNFKKAKTEANAAQKELGLKTIMQ
jgi:hypothetical protein